MPGGLSRRRPLPRRSSTTRSRRWPAPVWPVGPLVRGATRARLHERIAAEFDRAERAVLAVTGQAALLDNNPVIQRSIRERNPDTDLINALQVELLRRWREASDADRGELGALILLSVNALAAAMQSTG